MQVLAADIKALENGSFLMEEIGKMESVFFIMRGDALKNGSLKNKM